MEQNSHGITLSARSHAEITGVSDVDCFNEGMVVLTTTMGTMTISGSGLNISKLSQEEGRVTIDGEFDSIEYSGKSQNGKGGFFSRLLR
ncbi:MAG: sporulation protein YabP [Clostridia bacterium]|nr:sporulation protein YabP [Clostridia bacterium]